MSDLKLGVQQVAFVIVGFRRNARAMTLTVAMPIVLLVLFNSIFGGSQTTTALPSGARLGLHAYFTAGIIAYSIMLTGFSSLLVSITTAREAGRLKRYRGTPLPSWVFLSAQIVANIVVIAVMVAALLLIGRLAYGISIPTGSFGPFVAYVLVGTATMCALGIALSRFTTTPDAAAALGPFTTVILGFISGTFVPVSTLPDWLRQLGRVFPLAHLAQGLQTSMLTHGGHFDATNLIVLAAWFAGGLIVAVRRFAWEPLAVA